MDANQYRTIIQDSGDENFSKRLLIGTATTGLVRIEWVQARYGQIIPTNWSMVSLLHYLDAYIPLRYQVDDAQNAIVKQAVENKYEWLLLVEHDTILPPDAFVRFGEYMREEKVPVVSGLYYTRSRPSEPLVYRGRGNSFFGKWQMGDLVWCDGVPTGALLIHCSILRAMYDDSPEYQVPPGLTLRRVFETPRTFWSDPESKQFNTVSGTSDLNWCTRIMKGSYFEKAGWPEYQKMEFPFLVDTNIFCRHIDPDGAQYP